MAAETTRVKDIPTTATTAAADDYVLLDGATNGTRKGLASNLITPAAHNADAGAHGMSASGRVVLTGTPAQARAAIGFGGTVTVAQLNAAGADARSALYYCSDCLTVNGPGSLVAWCWRTLTWRTLDDWLLATTDFTAWASDFVANSNSSELRGTNGALFRVFDNAPGGGFTGINSATSQITNRSMLYRRLVTGTNPNGYIRTMGVPIANVAVSKVRVFAGLNKSVPLTTSGVTMRVGVTTAERPTYALPAAEYSLCMDAGNVLGGLNAGLAANYLGCIREGSVNLSGSGATSVAVSTTSPIDLMVVCDLDSVKLYVGGVVVAAGTRTVETILYPFAIWANDGTSTTSANADLRNFCCGYLLN